MGREKANTGQNISVFLSESSDIHFSVKYEARSPAELVDGQR